MSRGFMWFAQNNAKTDYVRLSIKLAESIKKHNKINKVCVITDEKSKFSDKSVDVVKVLNSDDSEDHEVKWANEHKAFALSPFTHTIKLEPDMLWTINTDWWWNHLWQHDLVFSVHCRNFRDEICTNSSYRNLFRRNSLPDLYNGMIYFRKSRKAKSFFDTAGYITKNWQAVRTTMLINCHDEYPSTDVVFALAYRLLDPTNQGLIDYEWFKFLHHKQAINDVTYAGNHNNYLYPNEHRNGIYLGHRRISRVWHYFDKEIDVRNI